MNPEPSQTKSRCANLLSQISQTDLHNFRLFAEGRLLRLGLSASMAEDMVGKALAAIVEGTRQPRPQDVETRESFQNYVRGAISSVVEAATRKRRYTPVSIEGQGESGPALSARTAPDQSLEMRDLQAVMFARLREAPARLQPTIQAWEKSFLWADRIPSPTSRKHTHEVRLLARDIFQEIGGLD